MQSEARGFLETLFTGKPDDLYMLLWTLPEKKSRWFTEIAEAVQFGRRYGRGVEGPRRVAWSNRRHQAT